MLNLRKVRNGLLLCSALAMVPAQAAFHLWDVAEIYSSDDGSVQFIELFCAVNGQQFLNAHTLEAISDGNSVVFTFPGNSGSPTANKRLLIATSNFAALPGAVTPDFILPDNFINRDAANITLDFGPGQDVLNFTGDDLPNDGVMSIDDNLNVMTNSPTNFADQTGSITVLPVEIFSNGFEDPK